MNLTFLLFKASHGGEPNVILFAPLTGLEVASAPRVEGGVPLPVPARQKVQRQNSTNSAQNCTRRMHSRRHRTARHPLRATSRLSKVRSEL